jgi:hypothetical protein
MLGFLGRTKAPVPENTYEKIFLCNQVTRNLKGSFHYFGQLIWKTSLYSRTFLQIGNLPNITSAHPVSIYLNGHDFWLEKIQIT